MSKTVGRNAPCPCGSGLKYKRCCESKDLATQAEGNALIQDIEDTLCTRVYESMLIGFWGFFNPRAAEVPTLEELEEFYCEVYGHYPDMTLVEDLVLPLPANILERVVPVLEKLAESPPPTVPTDDESHPVDREKDQENVED